MRLERRGVKSTETVRFLLKEAKNDRGIEAELAESVTGIGERLVITSSPETEPVTEISKNCVGAPARLTS